MLQDDIPLTHLVDRQYLQQLQDRFAMMAGAAASIIDPQGRFITQPSEIEQHCMRVQEGQAMASCAAVEKYLLEKGPQKGEIAFVDCPLSDHKVGIVPIIHDRHFLGMWLLSKSRAAHFRSAPEGSKESPSDSIHYEHIATQVDFTSSMQFLSVMTHEIVRLANGQLNLTKEINYMTFYDAAFELPNSIGLQRDLRLNAGGNAYLVIVDTGGLKKVNTLYGRKAGDCLLQTIKNYILNLNIPNGALYRLDTADFGILIQDTQLNPDSLANIVETLSNRGKKPWNISLEVEGSRQIYADLHVGVIAVDSLCVSFSQLLNIIERSLEKTKTTGKPAIYNGDTYDLFSKRLELEMNLRHAVLQGMAGFYLEFQPIVDTGIGMWTGIEALCRWDSAELGPVSPGDFIPVAEAIGLISDIGCWVLEQAIRQIKKWQLDQLDHFFLSVNLSHFQLTVDDLDKIFGILNKHQYPFHKLSLEITKSSTLGLPDGAMETIQLFSEAGVIMTLINFGTGSTSLQSLNQLPVKIFKCHSAFVTNLEHESYQHRVFSVMVEMAHTAGMKIVGEGVETYGQAQCLLKHGIDFLQGHLLSKPLSGSQLEPLLDHFRRPVNNIVSMGYPRLDLSKLSGPEGGYALNPILSKLLNRCMQELFHNPDTNASIDIALSHIGRGISINAAYLFTLADDNGSYYCTNYWHKDIASHTNRADEIAASQNMLNMLPECWWNDLIHNGMVVETDTRKLSQQDYHSLCALDINAAVQFPIWNGGSLYGFVGFYDNGARNWTSEEIQLFYVITGIITSVINRSWLQNQVLAQAKIMENVLNNMNTIIYVTDLITNRILFANVEAEKLYGHTLKGHICWEALYGRTERCPQCPQKFLLDNPSEICQWESYHEGLNKCFKIRNSIISWTDDKLAHLEYAEDITALKNYQNQLEIYASTDTLTSVLNRMSFIKAASEMLETAASFGYQVTIAFIDVDGLKKMNDSYGHTAGDTLICEVVTTVRANTRASDILGRFGGDEFIVAFYKCTVENAENRMLSALKALSKKSSSFVLETAATFSYGLASNHELAYEYDSNYIDRLIDLADRRMLEQKINKYKSRPGLLDRV